jgi:uncharacterized protein YraI
MNIKSLLITLFFALILLFPAEISAQVTPTEQAIEAPTQGLVVQGANLRGGPGTSHPIVGSARAGQIVEIIACNSDCSWYQLETNVWIAAFLVERGTNDPPPAEALAPADSTPDPTASAAPLMQVKSSANLRGGPGTNHPIVGRAQPGQQVTVVARNEAGDWYQLADGNWIAAFLVEDVPAVSPGAVSPPQPVPQEVTPSPSLTPTPQPEPTKDPRSGQRYGAICRDGTRSNATGRGACSHHGGVAQWLVYP